MFYTPDAARRHQRIIFSNRKCTTRRRLWTKPRLVSQNMFIGVFNVMLILKLTTHLDVKKE